MPQEDGTGSQGGGGGRMGGQGAGQGGECFCPQCGYHVSHERGKPCSDMTCPNCGTRLQRR
jgi:hypothetical protein